MGKREDTSTTGELQSRCLSSSKGWRCNNFKFKQSNFCQKHHIQFQKTNPIPKPPKPPIFTVNQTIEVTSNEPSFKDSYFAAKILKILPNKNQFLIQYLHLLSGDNGVEGLVKIVDFDLIRPNPPPLPNPKNSFKIHQIVDAFYSDGWWKGEIVAYLEERGVYTVYFGVWDEDIDFGVDDLRVHQIWVGGDWVIPTIKMDIDVRRDEIDSQSDERKRKTVQSLPREGPCKKMQKEDAREGSSSEVPTRTLMVTTKTGSCTTNFMESDFIQWNDGCESEEETLVRNKKDKGHDSTDILTNLCATNFMESDFNQWDNVCESEEEAHVRNKKDTGHDSTDILTNSCTTNFMESDFNRRDDGHESQEEELVQGTCHDFTDILTNPSIGSSDYQTPNVCQKDSDFPFIKSLLLWKVFETMEVFISMPQKPHFRPLVKVNKSLREGTAIGYMASFVSVVENTRNAQLSAPVYDYVETLKALKELEDMGFDVQLLRARMDKLVSIKTATLKLDAELMEVEIQITRDKIKEESLHSDISEMDKKIAELHERSVEMKKMKQVILMKRLAKESNIIVLQKSVQKSEEELHNTVLHFNSAAACPW